MRYTGSGVGTALTFRPGWTVIGITSDKSTKSSILQQFESANLWSQIHGESIKFSIGEFRRAWKL